MDVRYEFVRCAACGGRYQLIDFHANPHAWICPKLEVEVEDIFELEIKYPEVRFDEYSRA